MCQRVRLAQLTLPTSTPTRHLQRRNEVYCTVFSVFFFFSPDSTSAYAYRHANPLSWFNGSTVQRTACLGACCASGADGRACTLQGIPRKIASLLLALSKQGVLAAKGKFVTIALHPQ